MLQGPTQAGCFVRARNNPADVSNRVSAVQAPLVASVQNVNKMAGAEGLSFCTRFAFFLNRAKKSSRPAEAGLAPELPQTQGACGVALPNALL